MYNLNEYRPISKKGTLFTKPPETEEKSARIVHVDGGAFVEQGTWRFHDAYFSILSDDNELIHFAENIGDVWSGVAEYEAIKWAVENIEERPLIVTSDCVTAISWARKGAKTKKHRLPKLDLTRVTIQYLHANAADLWNAANHSPKPGVPFVGRGETVKT